MTAGSSVTRVWTLAVQPVLRAFWEALNFPAAVTGPLLLAPFRLEGSGSCALVRRGFLGSGGSWVVPCVSGSAMKCCWSPVGGTQSDRVINPHYSHDPQSA